jgi:hypothetical protein
MIELNSESVNNEVYCAIKHSHLTEEQFYKLIKISKEEVPAGYMVPQIILDFIKKED